MTQARGRIANLAVSAFTLLIVHSATAEEAAHIPIRDSELLARHGFAPEVENVFMLEGALEAFIRRDEGAAPLTSESVDTGAYGTQAPSTTTVGWTEFSPVGEAQLYVSPGLGVACTNPSDGWSIVSEFDLPSGVRLDRLTWWVFDGSLDDDIALELWMECWPAGTGEPSYTLLASGLTSGASGRQFFTTEVPSGGVTIDNAACNYFLWVSFDACDPSYLSFFRASLAWYRQISPAPETATFSDVPTSHLFFRHIEALAASGITGGCAPDQFCPGAPLTRGQMAVFLAKALGLSWPN